MSIVTVQLGQCGNQIGGSLFSSLMNDLTPSTEPTNSYGNCPKDQDVAYKEISLERFFNREEGKTENIWNARSVMVDMEQKVIAHTMTDALKSGKWKYPDKQQFCRKRGSGNNWSRGFCEHGPVCKEPVMEITRREVEKCDRFGGFLTLQSLAGGTGSGVGTYVTKCLREEYPNSFIVNQVVWPYDMGEVIVQNYNAVLTLSHLYQTSDAVLTMNNDVLSKICSQLLAIKNVSFEDINSVIANNLACVFQPAYEGTEPSLWSQIGRNHLGDILEHLTPHPDYKLLSMRSIPQISERSLRYTTYQWGGLMRHLRQMLIADAAMEEGINWQIKASTKESNRSLCNLLMLRGKDVSSVDTSAFTDPKLYAPWVPNTERLKTLAHQRHFGQYDKFAVLMSNSQSGINVLERVVGRAWNMFSTRAYVHQYLQHGLTEEDFVDSFATLEQVISNYKHI